MSGPGSNPYFDDPTPGSAPAAGFGDDDFDKTSVGATEHSGANGAGGSDDRTCNNCGKEGHLKCDCPDIPEDQRGPGACFNCGKVGHNKVDCPEPRLCRHCNGEGHDSRECPDKPPEMCRNCGQEGHNVRDCTNPRKVDDDGVPVMEPEKAWELLVKASTERDLDDARAAIQMYVKAVPSVTYQELEHAFREYKLDIYLIACEWEPKDTYTLMNLQGQLNQKYQAGYFLNPKAPRAAMKDAWPPSPEENLERLASAGIPVQTRIPKCNNCGEVGHGSKACKEERTERTTANEVRCYNCDEIGHRPRDCPKPRPDRFTCRNCQQPGHTAKECTEPRSAEGVECKNCLQMGHFGKDCPDRKPMLCNNCGEEGHKRGDCTNPANPAMMKCRNCDGMGHSSRDCKEKKDWSRVKCQNCEEFGHGKARCPKPPAEDTNGDDGGFGGGFGSGGGNNASANDFGDDGGFCGGGAAAGEATGGPGGNGRFNEW